MSLSLFLENTKNAEDSQYSYIGLNQDHSLIATCTGSNLKICDTITNNIRVNLDYVVDLRMVEMLNRSNILVLVSAVESKDHPSCKLILWDNAAKSKLSELVFSENIKSVKMNDKFIVVVFETSVEVFDLDKMIKLKSFETCTNTKTLVSLTAKDISLLAIPSKEDGKVNIYDLSTDNDPLVIDAHQNKLSCITMNGNGSLLATASEKGTLIRIFNTKTSEKVTEIRRGSTQADIYCISFSPDSKFLCSTSSNESIHIFEVNPPKSWTSLIMNDRSFAKYSGNKYSSICCFNKESDGVFLLNSMGETLYLKFDTVNGGEATIYKPSLKEQTVSN